MNAIRMHGSESFELRISFGHINTFNFETAALLALISAVAVDNVGVWVSISPEQIARFAGIMLQRQKTAIDSLVENGFIGFGHDTSIDPEGYGNENYLFMLFKHGEPNGFKRATEQPTEAE